jgi:hypothetical protein
MHLVVREHERISVVAERQRPDERALTTAEAELLLRTCEREGIAAVARGYRSIKFRSYCGVIQAGSLLVALWYPRAAGADDDEPNGPVFTLADPAPGESPRQLIIRRLQVSAAQPARAWIDATTAEVATQLRLLLCTADRSTA